MAMISDRNDYSATFHDIRDGLSRWRFWLVYGLRDIIAVAAVPRWEIALLFIPFRTAIITVAFWGIFHDTLGESHHDYAAYVAIGYPVFALVSGSINSNVSLIKKNASILANMPFPIFAFVLRGSVQLIGSFVLSMLVYLCLVAAGIVHLTAASVLVVPAFLLVSLIVVANALAFSLLSIYLPNLMATVRSFTRFLFFATPIVWYPYGSGFRTMVADINPLAHLVALIRDPLLGYSPPALSWIVGIVFFALSTAFSLYALKRVRRYIVFRI